ncbi:MAG TPA: glycosyltransferase family 4 protein [Candidatus Didemnitutus sp.]|jgi:glycosyltransferase involved in cell wall biosynthesis
MSAADFRSEIESPLPLRFVGGAVTVDGWCLAPDRPEMPEVRLVAGEHVLRRATSEVRADVPRLFPGHPAALNCGFRISGLLPAGVFLARFEARIGSEAWRTFKELSLVVEPLPFMAVIDEPVATGTLSDRVKAGGWALDPASPVEKLTLRYGHREIDCVIGRPRRDVPAAHATVPQAANSGFETADFLVAGHGPVRVRARLADGRNVVAPTRVSFSIAHDEFHGPEIDLTAPRVPLPGYARRIPAAPASPAARPRNIIFLLPGSFASNSALHVAALANELSRLGHACTVAVTHDVATISHHEQPLFRAISQEDALSALVFPDGRGPDVIHCWTTRENVRPAAETLRSRHAARLVVHLEDNEQQLLALTLHRRAEDLAGLGDEELDRLVPADRSHPRRSRTLLAAADGVTVITKRLADFVPAGRAIHVIRPAADERYFFSRPLPDEFRRELRLSPGESILFYHGNVHEANAAEVRELYLALVALNRQGPPVRLIRTGIDTVDFLGPMAAEVAPFVLNLGHILHHRYLPPLMALADFFVQPGAPDAFNDYRFPSKLPEFFALGRPVVLPKTNLAASLRHGIDAYVLDQADAAGIVRAIGALRADAALRDRLAQGAREFAAANFSWPRSAAALSAFYDAVLRHQVTGNANP